MMSMQRVAMLRLTTVKCIRFRAVRAWSRSKIIRMKLKSSMSSDACEVVKLLADIEQPLAVAWVEGDSLFIEQTLALINH